MADNSYTPQVLDRLTYNDVFLVIDFIQNGEVFFRRWVGESFAGLLRVPVNDFVSQVAIVKATIERTVVHP